MEDLVRWSILSFSVVFTPYIHPLTALMPNPSACVARSSMSTKHIICATEILPMLQLPFRDSLVARVRRQTVGTQAPHYFEPWVSDLHEGSMQMRMRRIRQEVMRISLSDCMQVQSPFASEQKFRYPCSFGIQRNRENLHSQVRASIVCWDQDKSVLIGCKW